MIANKFAPTEGLLLRSDAEGVATLIRAVAGMNIVHFYSQCTGKCRSEFIRDRSCDEVQKIANRFVPAADPLLLAGR